MAVTPVGNPYVESSDLVANYPGASEALAERIDIVGVNPFADAAARDAAIPSPVQGQMCSLNDDNKGYRYDGSAWVLFSGAGDANFTNAATGTYTDGDSYKYITFTGSGELVVDQAGFADVLVIGGGGGGGLWSTTIAGGGGGAGAYLALSDVYMPAGTLTVTVGAGGSNDRTGGLIGGVSIVGTVRAMGGGGGAGSANIGHMGRPGGSGSGGGGSNTATTSIGGSAVFGSDAGNAGAGNPGTYSGGGGGGAGAVGTAAASGVGGNGGAGTSSSITGSAVTRAGGGGGGSNTTPGTGGSGGGGNGGTTSGGTAGSANTGSGGGGVRNTLANGRAGGSGIVIVRVVV